MRKPERERGSYLARSGLLAVSSYALGKLFATRREQIMSADKYPSIFSRQMEAIVFIILQMFFATRAVLKFGEAGEYIANSLARNIANKASRS